jgi:MarR family transcriptional regulator, organic hydroperoxide resistance regulator
MAEKNEKYCRCLYYSSNALARKMSKIAEEEFAITGLSPSYAFLIMIVNDKPGIQPTEISGIMMLNPSTVTRLTDKMVDKGYLERKADGKSVFIFPLKKSRDIDPKLKEAWMNLYKRYVNILGETEAANITSNIYSAAKKLEIQ